MAWQEWLPLLSPVLTLGVLAWWRYTDNIKQQLADLHAAVQEFRVELAELRGASHKHTGGSPT